MSTAMPRIQCYKTWVKPVELRAYSGILMTIIYRGYPIGSIKLPAGVYQITISSRVLACWDGCPERMPWVILDGDYVRDKIYGCVQVAIEEGRRNRLELIKMKPHLNLQPFPKISSEDVLIGLPRSHFDNHNWRIVQPY